MDNNTDHNKVKAEAFVHLVREKVKASFDLICIGSLRELLVVMSSYVALRDIKVDEGQEPEPELAQLADAAVYFLKAAGFDIEVSIGHEE